MSTTKRRPITASDLPPPQTAPAGLPIETVAAGLPPVQATLRAPTNLRVVSTDLLQSAVTPKARAQLEWYPPQGAEPTRYSVQRALDAGFTQGVMTATALEISAQVGDLATNTTYYFRVQAWVGGLSSGWSNVVSATTPQDTTAPGPPTSPDVVFMASGAARIAWAKPASANFKAVEIRIFNSAAKLVEYDVIDEADGTVYEWSAARNRAQSVGSPDGSPDRSIYVELRSKSWGGVFSSVVSATATLAPPADVTGATATWDGQYGSCTFRWNVVAGAVAYRLTIDGITKTVRDVEHVYDLAFNRLEHTGTADPSLTWSIVAVDALDQVSVTPATGTATLARPATPASVTESWAADTGIADEDWLLSWAQGTGIVGYRLTIDSLARDLPLTNRYPYPFSLNAQEHAGTAVPSLAWSLVAIDALGQTSLTPASGTAVNAAPPAPSAVTPILLFSGFRADVTATKPADFATYRYRIIQTLPSVADVTVDDVEAFLYRATTASATYQVGVTVRDVFGQSSTEALSATLAVDALTLAYLRAAATYTDSAGTAAATLAALKDNLKASGGPSYGTSGSWRWIRFERPLLDRYKQVTLSMTEMSGFVAWYLRTSVDGAAWSYFSGPLASSALVSVADETAARVFPPGVGTIGNPTTSRVVLPSIVEARYIELWFRNNAGTTRVDEFYPRRLVQSDDMEAESIRAFHIAALEVTPDKLFIPGTASFDSTLQLIAFRVPVSLDLGSGIYQGTGTFASPTTGLKLWNDSGIGRLATYNSGTVQVAFDSSGRLTWAAGAGLADAAGMRIAVSSASVYGRGYSFVGSASTSLWGLYGFEFGGDPEMELRVQTSPQNSGSPEARIGIFAVGGPGSTINISADAPSGIDTTLQMVAGSYARFSGAGLAVSTGTSSAPVAAGNLVIDGTATFAGGLNLGSATGAGTGELRASGSGSFGGSLGVTGQISGGYLLSSGASAGMEFARRDGAGSWVLYSLGTFARLYSTAAGADRMNIDTSGNMTISGTLTELSDRRVKRDVRALEGGLETILALAPKRYTRHDDPEGREETGLIAQDVQAILPGLVRPVGEDLGIRYTGLIPYIILALHEIAARLPGKP